ncbi:MAG TPA: glycosyltransferase [Kofleriaceae bacterium]|nr:glycosyltransferase [Kofleriaceae bacterium]
MTQRDRARHVGPCGQIGVPARRGTEEPHERRADPRRLGGARSARQAVRARRNTRVHVIRFARNRGKAEAVRQGVLHALTGGAAIVGYADSDLPTPASELARLVAQFEVRDVSVIMGSRVALLGIDIKRSGAAALRRPRLRDGGIAHAAARARTRTLVLARGRAARARGLSRSATPRVGEARRGCVGEARRGGVGEARVIWRPRPGRRPSCASPRGATTGALGEHRSRCDVTVCWHA